MHIADFGIRMLGANGIVGGNFGIATGAALSIQLHGRDDVVLSFSGREPSIRARSWSARTWRRSGICRLCSCARTTTSPCRPVRGHAGRAVDPDRARAFGIEGIEIDGMDADVVYDAVRAAAAAARRGDGPQFIAAECYRFEGHFSGDAMGYRDSTESDLWKKRDPLVVLSSRLIDAGLLTAG